MRTRCVHRFLLEYSNGFFLLLKHTKKIVYRADKRGAILIHICEWISKCGFFYNNKKGKTKDIYALEEQREMEGKPLLVSTKNIDNFLRKYIKNKLKLLQQNNNIRCKNEPRDCKHEQSRNIMRKKKRAGERERERKSRGGKINWVRSNLPHSCGST